MTKVIAEKPEVAGAVVKMVEIKHTRVMKNASGNNVTVVDHTDVMSVDDAISDSEAALARAEAQVTELKADIAEYKKIKG